MKIPKNMTEEQVMEVITLIISQISGKFKFGVYGIEDIRQEAFLLAIEALEKYDGERKLENFLRVHIRNRLNNLKRNKHARYEPPCKSCPFFNRALPNGCSAYDEKTDCDLWAKWLLKFQKRERFVNPIDIGLVSLEGGDNQVYEKTWRVELIELIRLELPAELAGDFLRFLDGVKLNKARRTKLFEGIGKIIEGSSYGQV